MVYNAHKATSISVMDNATEEHLGLIHAYKYLVEDQRRRATDYST